SNRGCQNLSTRAQARFWTPMTCGASGCGRSGTYTFINNFLINGSNQSALEYRRDDDHYLLELTQDTKVTWRVTAKFPSEAIISFTVRQTNGTSPVLNCPTYISTASGDVSSATAPSCQQAVTMACLPGRNTVEGPFRYLLRARPSMVRL